MERKEFFEAVCSDVKSWVGKESEVTLRETVKLNGTAKMGLIIRREAKGNEVSPVLYLDDYYDVMQKTGRSFNEVVGNIKKCLAEDKDTGFLKETIDLVSDWNRAKNHVYPALISAERNQKLLESIVSDDFLDLKIIYLLRLDNEELGNIDGIVKITKSLMASYNISQDELHEYAMKNLEGDGVAFTSMKDIMANMFKETDNEPEPVERLNPGQLYCLTNEGKHFGAGSMLDIRLIKKTADGKNCYILPSSIHEVLVLPEDASIDTKKLGEMVRSVNATEVAPEEVLSDHVYYFDAAKGEILSMAS